MAFEQDLIAANKRRGWIDSESPYISERDVGNLKGGNSGYCPENMPVNM